MILFDKFMKIRSSDKKSYIRIVFMSCFLLCVNVHAAESLKDIKHEEMGFGMRVPVNWLPIKKEKSVRYSMGVSGGKMDVKRWEKKSASAIVRKLKERITQEDPEYAQEEYLLGKHRVVGFSYKAALKEMLIKQNVNVIETANGTYIVQFGAELKEFNEFLNSKILATFRVL
jgi:hypothetical protein